RDPLPDLALHAQAVAVDRRPLRLWVHALHRLRRERAPTVRAEVLEVAVDERRVEDERLVRGPAAHADAGLIAVEADPEAAAHDHLPLAARVPGEAQARLGQDGLAFDAAAQVAVRGQPHAVREIAGV